MFNGYGILVGEDEQVLKVDGGDVTEQCECT